MTQRHTIIAEQGTAGLQIEPRCIEETFINMATSDQHRFDLFFSIITRTPVAHFRRRAAGSPTASRAARVTAGGRDDNHQPGRVDVGPSARPRLPVPERKISGVSNQETEHEH